MQAANRLMTYPNSTFNEIQYKAFQKALDEYRLSLEYVADFPSGRYNLGNFYSKLNEMAKAEENYREAITLDNLFFPAKTNLALIYYRQGKTDQAAGLFNDLVINHPDVTEGYYYLALLYGEQQKYTDAITLLETAIAKSVANSRIYYNLGLLYQMTGNNAKCESTLVKGLALYPGDFDILYALFAYHMKLNDKAKAAPYIEQLKSWFPNDRQVQEMYTQFNRNAGS
jgi:tetratricopeptide (TPR) repeat protein